MSMNEQWFPVQFVLFCIDLVHLDVDAPFYTVRKFQHFTYNRLSEVSDWLFGQALMCRVFRQVWWTGHIFKRFAFVEFILTVTIIYLCGSCTTYHFFWVCYLLQVSHCGCPIGAPKDHPTGRHIYATFTGSAVLLKFLPVRGWNHAHFEPGQWSYCHMSTTPVVCCWPCSLVWGVMTRGTSVLHIVVTYVSKKVYLYLFPQAKWERIDLLWHQCSNVGAKPFQSKVQWNYPRVEIYLGKWRNTGFLQGQWHQLCTYCSQFCSEILQLRASFQVCLVCLSELCVCFICYWTFF